MKIAYKRCGTKNLIGARRHTAERLLQRQRPPPAVLRIFEFSCTFIFNSSSNYSLNMWCIIMDFIMLLFITAEPITYQNTRTMFCTYVHMWWYRNVFLMALSKESGFFHHVTKGMIGQATHAWVRDVSPRVPIRGYEILHFNHLIICESGISQTVRSLIRKTLVASSWLWCLTQLRCKFWLIKYRLTTNAKKF